MSFRTYDDALRAQGEILRAAQWSINRGANFAWLQSRYEAYGTTAAASSAGAVESMAADAVKASAVWLSPALHELVSVAAEDFDMDEPQRPEDVFLPHGMLVLPEPFVVVDAGHKRAAWRAMCWRHLDVAVYRYGDDAGFSYGPLPDMDHTSTEGGVRFQIWSYAYDPDDYDAWALQAVAERGHPPWSILHATTIPYSLMSALGELSGEGDLAARWMRYWRTLQRVMGQRIVTAERQMASRGARREAQRRGLDDPSTVVVVTLRRPRKSRYGQEEGEPGGREYRHQWIVQPYWRWQNYPSEGVRRQILIPEHVKGPEGAPLIVKRRVFKVTR